MDQDTKLTYTVIVALVVILGAIAYFLQGNMSYPQVHIPSDTSTTTLSTGFLSIKKPVTNNTNKKSTTTMTLPDEVTQALITTNKGIIEITFASNTPKTVENFVKLASSGFYNGTRFHRVIRDFMIQGGDPLSKDLSQKDKWGTGGPGYQFEDEIHQDDKFVQGVIAMANSGPNTNGSQFFIVTSIAGTPWLTGKHTIFGHVTKGLEIALRIGDLQVDGTSRPFQDAIVEKIEIK